MWREGREAINAPGVQVSSRSSEVERSLGTLTSGNDANASAPRPSALYLATNIDDVACKGATADPLRIHAIGGWRSLGMQPSWRVQSVRRVGGSSAARGRGSHGENRSGNGSLV